MGPPKNKAFIITKIKEKRPDLDVDKLSKMTILQLTKLQKEPIEPKECESESLSFVQLLGCH